MGLSRNALVTIKEVWTDMRPLSLRKKMDNPASIFETSGVHLNETIEKRWALTRRN